MSSHEIIEELKRIADENGGILRAEDVVDSAAHKSSPLHDHFDWNNDTAGHRWRLHQARNLIRVSVEYLGTGDDQRLTRVFVSLTPDREEAGGGYRTVQSVLTHKQYREQLMADALAEMQLFQRKYAELQELADVFAAMKRVGRKSSAA